MDCAAGVVLFPYVFFLLHFKTSPNLLQSFRRMHLPHCVALNLQKCFAVQQKLHLTFQSVDNDSQLIFFFGKLLL